MKLYYSLLLVLSCVLSLHSPLLLSAAKTKVEEKTKMEEKTKANPIKKAVKAKKGQKKMEELKATITTNVGAFTVRLFHEKAPITVSNFVELARAGKYNGVVFHRVIPNFMIQGGDPDGTGRGGPGYSFQDEFHPELTHSKPGMLSMANAGPNTNGSQFFVTVAETSFLDNRHAVFGEVVEGYEVVQKISELDRDSQDRPNNEVKMETVVVLGDWFKPVAFEKNKR